MGCHYTDRGWGWGVIILTEGGVIILTEGGGGVSLY